MTALQRKAVERAESGSRPDLPLNRRSQLAQQWLVGRLTPEDEYDHDPTAPH
jgi:hypothetical protein